MGGLRRGPGGPAEWRVGKLRQAALSGAQAVLEEILPIFSQQKGGLRQCCQPNSEHHFFCALPWKGVQLEGVKNVHCWTTCHNSI